MKQDPRILMIAFHYPPCKGSSGLQRTLKFSRYLSDYGWRPVVLTASESAHQVTSSEQLGEVPRDVPVYRALCLDTARHLSIRGRYLSWMTLPDRWVSWVVGGVVAGLYACLRHRPAAIWSTYPIATAHLIAWTLARTLRIPWIADFRDPMCQSDYPRDPTQWRSFDRVERRAIATCSSAVFTSPGAVSIYQDRYPSLPRDRFQLIRNGYDETDAGVAGSDAGRAVARTAGAPIKIVHSGTLYPIERDPEPLFRALAELKNSGRIRADGVQVILRATGHDEDFRPLLSRLEIDDIVRLEPVLSYGDALQEMSAADGLLLLQGSSCNFQIPAKAYEYIQAGRPILALADPEGDTGELLRSCGVRTIVAAEDGPGILELIPAFLDQVSDGTWHRPDPAEVASFSRHRQAGELARLLDRVTGAGRTGTGPA